MSHAPDADAAPAEAVALAARLAALRSEGAWRADPARFHYLEALARRLPAQTGAVRRRLQMTLDTALDEYTARSAPAPAASAGASPGAAPPQPGAEGEPGAPAPLAELNAYIAQRSAQAAAAAAAAAPASLDEPPAPGELASVRRFRQAWSRHRAQEQVALAAARQPAGAGPLNSHRLVLQSLALMEALSPSYLQGFLMQVESLQWLARAADKAPKKPATPAKSAKATKAARRPPGV